MSEVWNDVRKPQDHFHGIFFNPGQDARLIAIMVDHDSSQDILYDRDATPYVRTGNLGERQPDEVAGLRGETIKILEYFDAATADDVVEYFV